MPSNGPPIYPKPRPSPPPPPPLKRAEPICQSAPPPLDPYQAFLAEVNEPPKPRVCGGHPPPQRPGCTAPVVPFVPTLCPFCREAIQPGAQKCRYCGEWLTEKARRNNRPQKWSPGVAALLSLFVPGLGQIYRAQFGYGLLWLVFTPCAYMVSVPVGLLLHFSSFVLAAVGDPRA